MSASPEIRVLPTLQDIFYAAAQHFVPLATQAVSKNGRFTVAFAGGSTPKGLYSLLATEFRSSIPWKQTYFFWGDERHVPPDHPDSNFRMANEAMLSKVPVAASNVFRVPTERKDANEVAAEYEQTIRSFFQLKTGELPGFDLILLGLGPDGHTASLFPDTSALQETSRLVVANWIAKFQTYRITLTLPVLNHAGCISFLVAGADKAHALHEVLEGDASGEQFPAKLVKPAQGKLIWFVDRAAASSLSNSLEQNTAKI